MLLTDGTPSIGVVTTPYGVFTLSFPSGVNDSAQAALMETYIKTQTSSYTLSRVSNQLVFTSVVREPGSAITTSWNVAGSASAPQVVTSHLGRLNLTIQDRIVLNFNGSTQVTHEFASGRTLAQTVSSIVGLTINGVTLTHDDNFALGTLALSSGYARISFSYDVGGVIEDNTSSSVSITSGNAVGHSLIVTEPTTTRQGVDTGLVGSLTPYTITLNSAHSSTPLTGFVPSASDGVSTGSYSSLD